MKRTLQQLAKMRQATKDCNERWHRAAFAALGGKCLRCGFTDERALQIDHVNGGGSKEHHRRQKNGAMWRRICLSKYYRLVVNDTTGKYQLLCANCNWIKRTENGEMKGKNHRHDDIASEAVKSQMTFTWQPSNAD